MPIWVNGARRTLDTASVTIEGLLKALELSGRRVAVEINEEIVPRSQYGDRQLADGDRIEIVHAIGGG